MRYVRSSEARLKEAGERLAVFLPATRGIHVLNATGRLLLTYLEEPAGIDELVSMLAAATDGDPTTIRGDLEAALEEFLRAGVLERVE